VVGVERALIDHDTFVEVVVGQEEVRSLVG